MLLDGARQAVLSVAVAAPQKTARRSERGSRTTPSAPAARLSPFDPHACVVERGLICGFRASNPRFSRVARLSPGNMIAET
jgi:hypothetical protein